MLDDLEIVQVFRDGAGPTAHRAISFAANLARSAGAGVFRHGSSAGGDGLGFYQSAEVAEIDTEPDAWVSCAQAGRTRIVLDATSQLADPGLHKTDHTVLIELEPWETEETLFAHSGIAELYGDPDREPLTPAGNFAAHSIGYAAFAAIVSLWAKMVRFGQPDAAIIDGRNVMTWVNWKAPITAMYGQDLRRLGSAAVWPMIECKDGFAVFVYQERDWDAIVGMVGDPALKAEPFLSGESRLKNRSEFVNVIRAWAKTQSRADMERKFMDAGLPGAIVLGVADLLSDPLLLHRDAIETTKNGVKIPRPPVRVASQASAEREPTCQTVSPALPLAGMRVLDFGIITAGAGVSVLLADMGAEVLKIESPDRPDTFRKWPGAREANGHEESPLFRSNNRNKFAIAIDLKDPAGRDHFFELVKTADIVIENYRRGVLDRLGGSFQRLIEVNPGILLASISGQGLEGPGAMKTSFGTTLEANCGLASLTRYADSPPFVSGPALNYPDQTICLYGAAIVAAHAVDCRQRGVGRQIDVSQRDCAIYQLGDVMAYVSSGADDADPDTIRHAVGRPRLSAFFRCSDGEFVALTANDESVARHIEGLSSLSEADVRAWASKHGANEAVSTFLAAGGGGASSRLGRTILDDPSLLEKSIFAHSPDGSLVKGFPFQLVRTPMTVTCDAPRVGEHTQDFV